MKLCFLIPACAAVLSGCMAAPTPRNNVAVRQVPFTPDSGTIAIHCGLLIDGVQGLPLMDALVVIRDGRIRTVKADASGKDAAAAMVPVLDLRDYTCLPGLIDMHTHLTDRPEDTADLRVYFTRSQEEILRLSRENAEATVLAGFTSVRNVGTYVAGTDVLLRDAINSGEMLGPRMQVSGPYLTVPHGGGDLCVVLGIVGVVVNAELGAQLRHACIFRHDRALLLGCGLVGECRTFRNLGDRSFALATQLGELRLQILVELVRRIVAVERRGSVLGGRDVGQHFGGIGRVFGIENIAGNLRPVHPAALRLACIVEHAGSQFQFGFGKLIR